MNTRQAKKLFKEYMQANIDEDVNDAFPEEMENVYQTIQVAMRKLSHGAVHEIMSGSVARTTTKTTLMAMILEELKSKGYKAQALADHKIFIEGWS